MDTATMQLADREVGRVAANYARRVWWADREELVQVGRLAMMEAAVSFDERVGAAGFPGYAARAAVFAIKRHLWRTSAPVSGGLHRPEKQLAGLHRQALPEETTEDGTFSAHVPAGLRVEADPGRAMDDARWAATVRARLETVARRTGLHRLLPVLLEERTQGDLAEEAGVTRGRVDSLAKQLRARCMVDEHLWDLLKQRND